MTPLAQHPRAGIPGRASRPHRRRACPPMMTAAHLAAERGERVDVVLLALEVDERNGLAPPALHRGATVWYLPADLRAWWTWIQDLAAELDAPAGALGPTWPVYRGGEWLRQAGA